MVGLTFYKWFRLGEERFYYFTLDGNYSNGEIRVAAKEGREYDDVFIRGPDPFCRIESLL